VVRACKEMDLQSWKLHLRIADYTALDFYERVLEVLRSLSVGLEDISIHGVYKAVNSAGAKREASWWNAACPEKGAGLAWVRACPASD